MRLSIDTLILLARAGDRSAEVTAIFIDQNRTAVASCRDGRIGAGWPGLSNWNRNPVSIKAHRAGAPPYVPASAGGGVE